ncbi:hypothetical protein ARMSODRAFT_579859 [Armillaria solidipes]|uniref:Uncharacterized protein n=1 Tax=Armillaria solidipes TaxID=1076256 RepID=A0A2H3CDP1_9AGAR|nr:hypothetical protein ARMSODRAFT_579859 [Armillaria solidipes]
MSIPHLSFSTASTTPVASGSGSNSFLTVAIVTGVVGGVSTCVVIGLVVYLLVQRRRQRKGLRRPGYYDTEKGPAITKNIPALPAAYHSKGELSSWFTESPQPARPAIKVITDFSIGKALPKSPSRPTTPKWKLKRVPVPRLSRLPPSPMLSRARSRLSFSRSSSRRTTKIDVPPVPILPSPSLPPTPVPTVLASVPAEASSPTVPFPSSAFSTPSVATPLHSLPPTTLAIPTSDPNVPSSAVSPLYTFSPAFPSPSVFLSSVGTLPSVNQRPTVS